ncbi:MAG: site-2 protease family protein [Anaerolineae bacterium]|nr:site-2 protease family protein [Anaerolineae bacterium]
MSLSESLYGELPERTQPHIRSALPQADNEDRLTQALDGLMLIQEMKRDERRPVIVYRGTLLGDAEDLYPVIAARFKAIGYTPMLRREGQMDIVAALEGLMVARRFSTSGWVHGLLLLVTIVTTMLSGAGFQGYTFEALLRELTRYHNYGYIWTMMQAGAPFALTLLLILGVHEMGHYVAARRHGIDVTLPYFIPLPFISILGTLGAVIFIKSALTNRKALFDVGISGPLAGFVVALVAFIIGLKMQPYPTPNLAFYGVFRGFAGLGMPPLLHWIGELLRPDVNLGLFVTRQPVALAAWFGMLLTVLNLLPIGQLDGGHVMYTLFGRFAWTIAMIALIGLIVLGLTVFPSFLFYAVLAALTGVRHPPPGNDITPLNPPRRILGYATIVLFFLILTTTPFLARG